MNKLLQNLHILLILFVGYTGWLGFDEFQQNLDGKKQELEGAKSQVERDRLRIKKIKVYQDRLERSREKLAVVRSELLEFQKKLPVKKDPTVILDFLSEQADRIRLVDTVFKPLPEKNMGSYFIEEYEIQGVGTFQQFLVYLEQMKAQSRVYNISFLELRAITEKDAQRSGARFSKRFQMLEARIVFQLYRFNPGSFANQLGKIKAGEKVK